PEGSGYTNLNTAIFDQNGVHWFTGQSGIYGRFDPRSGEMKVFDAPKGPGPYGIHVTPQGVVYYASLAGSHIARIDAASGAAAVIEPPTRGQGARRVWSDSKGSLWVAEWNSGNLSRYEPRAGTWSQWKAPGSSPRVYAVYVDETDKVWASEWSAQVMLRFDEVRNQQRDLFETLALQIVAELRVNADLGDEQVGIGNRPVVQLERQHGPVLDREAAQHRAAREQRVDLGLDIGQQLRVRR